MAVSINIEESEMLVGSEMLTGSEMLGCRAMLVLEMNGTVSSCNSLEL